MTKPTKKQVTQVTKNETNNPVQMDPTLKMLGYFGDLCQWGGFFGIMALVAFRPEEQRELVIAVLVSCIGIAIKQIIARKLKKDRQK